MDEVTRLLYVAVDALWRASRVVVNHDYELALDVQGAAVVVDELLALVGCVDW